MAWGVLLTLFGGCGDERTADAGAPASSAAATAPASTRTAPAPARPLPATSTPAKPTAAASDATAADADETEPALVANAPFTPSPDHSPIVADGAAMDPNNFHQYRGRDGMTKLEPLSPVIAPSQRLHIERRAVRVRTEPDALVAAWANQLGSFATGQPGIVVRADADGIAVIDVMTGNDGGGYPILVASPARAGVVVVTLNAE